MSSLTDLRSAAFDALSLLAAGGCDFADVFLEINQVERLRLENSRAEELVSGGERGAGLRLQRGEATAFASTNDLTPEGLLAAARALVTQVDHGAPEPIRLTQARMAQRSAEQTLGQVAWPERIQLALEADAAARRAGTQVAQVTVLLAGSEQSVAVARSDGSWCEDERTQTVLWVQAVAQRDGTLQTGYESAGGSVGWELFTRRAPGEVGALAGQRAMRMLDARPAPGGRMPVVLAAQAGGTMVHEAIGHSLEADLVQRELSPFGDRIGQLVASPLVSVVDDATLAGWRGSFAYDDEGTPAERTLLVDHGILQGFMHDLKSARQAGSRPTGNGRRQSYAYRPIPRMTNTMIVAGEQDPAAILRAVAHGLYVVRMGGGQVNTVNGDFVFEVSEGYLIRNGELSDPVRGATLIGSGQQVLKSIDMVGSDHGQGIGTCGKDGQGVPVADAQPTLRIPEITVGGTG